MLKVDKLMRKASHPARIDPEPRAFARRISRLASLCLAFVLITGVAGRVSGQNVDPARALAALQDKILSKGPNGEDPAPASSVSLSAEEIEKIRGLKAKAAIVLTTSSPLNVIGTPPS